MQHLIAVRITFVYPVDKGSAIITREPGGITDTNTNLYSPDVVSTEWHDLTTYR